MKTLSKLLLIPTLLIGLVLPMQAQQMETSPVNLGVKGGLNFSNFNGDALSNADYMTRGNVGLFLKYDVSPYFAIQPEANVSWTGAKMDVNDIVLPDGMEGLGESGDVKLKQTYIQ
ncbi:MAG TPA: outer membrane beta-barrel protein, partial [Fodinibius sp.]|nr:outer membrane beta-barrel protein [Fodinibius sp.]